MKTQSSAGRQQSGPLFKLAVSRHIQLFGKVLKQSQVIDMSTRRTEILPAGMDHILGKRRQKWQRRQHRCGSRWKGDTLGGETR